MDSKRKIVRSRAEPWIGGNWMRETIGTRQCYLNEAAEAILGFCHGARPFLSDSTERPAIFGQGHRVR